MKTDHLIRALKITAILLTGAFVMACGENNPENPTPDPDPTPSADEIVINPKTVILDASRSDQIVEYNDEYMIVKDLALGTPLTSGTKAPSFIDAQEDYYFMCTATEQIPDGAFKKIKDVTPFGNQFKVTFDPLARFGLQDVIKNGSCNKAIPHALIESVTDEEGKKVEVKGNIISVKVGSNFFPGEENVKFDLGLTVEFDCTPEIKISISDGVPTFKFGMEINPDVKVTTDFSLKYKKTLVDEDDLRKFMEKTLKIKLSTITVPVGPVPVVVTPEVDFTFEISLSGEVHAKGTLVHWKPSYSCGMELFMSKDGDEEPDIKPFFDKNPPEVKPEFFKDVQLTAEGTLKESLKVVGKAKLYGTLTGALEAEIYAKQKLTMGATYDPSANEVSALPIEVKPSAGVDGTAKAYLDLFKWKPEVKGTWTVVEFDWDPWIITDFKYAPVVVTIDGAVASDNSILISGAALADETQDETKIEECGFEYYNTSPNEVTKVISSMDGSTYFHEQVGLMKKFTSKIENLQPNTTYYIRAFASNSKGIRFGKIVEVTTTSSSGEQTPDAVDLGLPSGIKWASFNLGATKPEEYGDYYAWGEIEPKESYTWGTYKWCNGSERTLTKYNTDGSYGIVDNKIILDPEDDAAFMKLGGKWRMPTKAEQDELIQNCNIVSAQVNGVQGRRFTSKINGNSVFIPTNGYYHSPGSSGEYWSSSLWVGRPFDAYDLDFTQSLHLENGGRYESRGIRPVYDDGTQTSVITNTPTNVGSCSVEIPITVSTTETISGIGIVYSTNIDDPDTRNYGDGGYIVYGISEICSSLILNELKPNTLYYVRPFINITGESETELYGNTVQFTTKGLSYSTEYVDIGLSVKWATCNLGSSLPSDMGAFYRWGETAPTCLSTAGYKWKGTDGFTKYNANDGKVTLEAADDAASVNLGEGWRMPTDEELYELRNQCTWAQAIKDGVKGCTVTGPNGRSIFIPVSAGTTVFFDAEILSSSLNTAYEGYQYVHALSYHYYENSVYYNSTFRDGGIPVRPVYDDSEQKPQVNTPEPIDLGLSVKWASFNLGASKPEENGDYYAWGETEPYYVSKDPVVWKAGKEAGYHWSSYKFNVNGSYSKYNNRSSWGIVDNKTVLDSEDDPAHVNLGGRWRMPTSKEWNELMSNCTWTWTTRNGVVGRMVTGPNGNSIFLPANGYWYWTDLCYPGQFGHYWSSSLNTTDPREAWYLTFNPERIDYSTDARSAGRSVRPIYDE